MISEKETGRLTNGASFVIDRDQRIVVWSGAAGELLRITRGVATGLYCASVVKGRDQSGEPVCRVGCPGFRSRRRGRPGHTSLMTADPGGTEVSLKCSVIALSGQEGNSLVTLAKGSPHTASSSHENIGSVAGTSDDLAEMGNFAASISADMVNSGAEHTLDWLRQTLDVEAVELFLREPGSDDMLLSYIRSPFESAFNQINRFHPGEGFPGLAFSRDAALQTTDLQTDDLYLRSQVKTEGFISYLCVPLRGSDGIIGTLSIAARRPNMDLVRAQRILEWASVPLAAILESASLKARLDAVPQPTAIGVDGALETISLHVLQQMMSVGGATTGELMVHNPDLQGIMHRVEMGAIKNAQCQDFQGSADASCPALTEEHGIALYGERTEWPSPCQQMAATRGVIHCIPLIADGEHVGLAKLQYRDTVPTPPTNHLTMLLAIAAQATPSLLQAREATLKSVAGELAPEAVNLAKGQLDPLGIGDVSLEDVEKSFLNIRCFGSFELYKEGRLLPPDAIQRRGALVVLKILLINDGRPVSRDMLIEALWPGADPNVAANRLYVLIHALRRAIEPSDHRYKRRWTFICNDGDRYYISPDAPYRCDVQDFRQAVELGERQVRSGDWREAINSYEIAFDLYTGDLFEDEPYAEWCWAERENLREAALDIALKIGAQHDQWGAPEKSIVYYQRALRIDPLREQFHRRLIEALVTAGRHSEAKRQYSVCKELLWKELGIEPMPETQRLQRMAFGDQS